MQAQKLVKGLNIMKLDIGCGKNKHEGYIGVDKEKFDCVDILHNLNNFPWPFNDNSVSEVLCHNILEHLESPWRAVREIIRICQLGARIHVRFPVPEHPNAWKDPDHKYTFTPQWFEQFGELEIVKNEKHCVPAWFEQSDSGVIEGARRYIAPLFKLAEEMFELIGLHRFGPDEHRLTLEVVKQ